MGDYLSSRGDEADDSSSVSTAHIASHLERGFEHCGERRKLGFYTWDSCGDPLADNTLAQHKIHTLETERELLKELAVPWLETKRAEGRHGAYMTATAQG